MCFDWTDDQKGRDSDTFTATEYIDIIKTNPVCSSIDIKKQDSKQSGIYFSDITGTLNYDANKEQYWRTEREFSVTDLNSQLYMFKNENDSSS